MQLHDNYTAYATIYDDFLADRSDTIEIVKRLIQAYRPNASTLLDLACGTGGIAHGLTDSHTIIGLDKAEPMLAIARQKLPNVTFIQTDMVDFEIDQKFDVIYCLHNSMNHLLSFAQWEATFANVAYHLTKGGLFIFDVNPPQNMDALASKGSGVRQIGDRRVASQVVKNTTPGRYQWYIRILDGDTSHQEVISIATFPLQRIQKALGKHFAVVESFVLEQAQSENNQGRAYFACSKR